MPKREISVVGMLHRVTPPTVEKITDAVHSGPLKIMLEREPDNPHDFNAIKVIIVEKPFKGLHIGYVPRRLAELYSPKLDSGKSSVREGWITDVDAEFGSGSLLVDFRHRGKKKPKK